jgi:ATP-dependent DNA helicase RecQ
MTECRREALLAYFGDDYGRRCGNCDTCLTPPKTWDATQAAQKLLSCIYRSGQRFGAAHVVDILLGKTNEKILQYGHEKLSTFGIGKGLGEQQWRSLIRQLLIRGFLEVDVQGYGGLRLTEQCRPVLRGEIALALRTDTVDTNARAQRSRNRLVEVAPELEPLWRALRDCRKRLAEENGIAPFMVFHDATLRLMAVEQPLNEAALLRISGVGQSKLEHYGAAFLEVIREQVGELALS